MRPDVSEGIHALVEFEAQTFDAGHASPDLRLYRRAIAPRRAARLAARTAAAVTAVAGVVVVGLLVADDPGPDRMVATTVEALRGFAPEAPPLTFAPDGAAVEAGRSDAEPAGQRVGCASLDEYAALTRPADVWSGSRDPVIAVGSLTEPGAVTGAIVTVRGFGAADEAGGFVDGFASLATACGSGVRSDAGLFGTASEASAVRVAAVPVSGSEAPAAHATVALAAGGTYEVYLVAASDAAVSVVVPPGAPDVGPEVLEQFVSYVRDLG
ncbi:hypothetical protein QQX09_07535 [Demequina sp. SYSU T00192]|uniref:Uncharacterized protein n=1 Tax=Demequina litoralis TaxID=3051660 RepID=A0ABT8G9R2_9MICO|nr:hypothetical protein [Demequina sp. SYSU T00192]MDN4475704.1 hypothetical protein [Demequina sp. SYSU T00192]